MHKVLPTQLCFLRAACVLAALVAGGSSKAADITYETRALTETDGALGPGLGVGVRFRTFDQPVLNGAGQTAFQGSLAGTGVTGGNEFGIWSEGGGSGLALVARAGNQAPGTAVGVNFSAFERPVLNGAGQTAFTGLLTGAGITSENSSGIWSEGGESGLSLVARRGDQAPGTVAGVNFSTLGFFPVLNEAGQTAFRADLTGTDVTSANESGIWSEGGGSGAALVARAGHQAPGTAAGVNFSTFSFPVLNGEGQTAFSALLTGAGVTAANEIGIWSEGGGSGLALVARYGSQAPGTAIGVYFDGFSIPVLNGAGRIAFEGTLDGAGVTASNDGGIWSEGGGSGLALVVREGSQAPGLAAGVNFGSITFNSLVLNGAGQTAFHSSLTGVGVTAANDRAIWSEGGGSGLALVAREGNQAPGTAVGVNFSSLFDPVLNGAGQTAFRGILTGAGVTSANNGGIWATDHDGLLQLIVRTGDQFDVSNDPLSPDPRTISSVSLVTDTGGEDGRPTSFNDAGQLVFQLRFTDGSEGIIVATIAAPPTVTITAAVSPAIGFDFTWNSQVGKVYDLVTSTDLATPVAQWPVHAGYGDIPATGTTTTVTAVPVAGPQRFFAVIEKDAAPAN